MWKCYQISYTYSVRFSPAGLICYPTPIAGWPTVTHNREEIKQNHCKLSSTMAYTYTEGTCCCGDACKAPANPNCGTLHRCLICERTMHTICGFPVPEEEQTRGHKYAQICNDCGNKKQPSQPARTEPEARTPTPPPPKRQRTKKTTTSKKRPDRPDIVYEDLTTDATEWVFPAAQQPTYLAPFLEFMGFLNNAQYDKSKTFTKAELLKICPKHVLAFLTYKAFGTTKRASESRPTYARSTHIKNLKMKISYYMPSGAAWVDLENGSGHGNPTRHKSVNKLIADIIQFETRGEGADAHDVRDMTIQEFEKELELFRSHKDVLCKYRNPLIGIYQFHFITRADDVCNFKLSDPKGHSKFPFALSQSVRWSKNVRDSRNCPDQLLLPSMDHKSCIFVALAIWLEYHLRNNPEAVYMMSASKPPPNPTKDDHKKFIHSISKTYRNRLQSVVFKNPEFKDIYKGNDPRPLGLHSKRKMGSTQAKRRGAGGEQVDHRGRWVSKKGSRIVNAVYIDPEDEYADAFVATKLCLGGPIKYKVKDELASHITTNWLAEFVIPNIANRYVGDQNLIHNLGLAMLFIIMDEDAMDELLTVADLPWIKAVQDAYKALPVENKPDQPVNRVPLHVYRIGEETFIEEIWQQEQAGTNQQPVTDTTANTPQANLARVPASGGNAATQQVLQTLLIQNQQLQRSLQEMEQRLDLRDQANRSWLEEKMRRINDNVRRFGGTIQSGLSRQDGRRTIAVARGVEEEAAAPVTQQPGTINRGGRNWPTLCPNVNSLLSLWTEYEFGIGNRKPARFWKGRERGNKSQKQTYYRRNCIWKLQVHLTNKGHRIEAANAIIRRTYGENTSITNVAKAIVEDRKRYRNHGGMHPNIR